MNASQRPLTVDHPDLVGEKVSTSGLGFAAQAAHNNANKNNVARLASLCTECLFHRKIEIGVGERLLFEGVMSPLLVVIHEPHPSMSAFRNILLMRGWMPIMPVFVQDSS